MSNGQQTPLPQPQQQQQQVAIAQHDIASGRPITFYDVSGKPAGVTSSGGTFYSVGANEDILFRTAQEAQQFAASKGQTGQQVGVSNVPSSDYWRMKESEQMAAKREFGAHDVRQPISAKILSEMGYLDTTTEKIVGGQAGGQAPKPGEWGYHGTKERPGGIVQPITEPKPIEPTFNLYDRAAEINRELGLNILNIQKGKPIDVSGFPVIAVKPARPYIEPTKYTTRPLYDFTKDISKRGEEYADKLFAPSGSMFTPLGAAKESARITTKAITSLPEFVATVPYGYEMIARDIYGGKVKEVPGKIITGAGLMALGLGTSIKEKPIETLGTLAVQSVILGGFRAPRLTSELRPNVVISDVKNIITTPLKPEAPKGYVIPGLQRELLTQKEYLGLLKASPKEIKYTPEAPTPKGYVIPSIKDLTTKGEAVSSIGKPIKNLPEFYNKEVPAGYVPEGLKQLRYMPRAKTGIAKFIASEEAVSYIPTFERAKPITSIKRQVLVAERELKIMGELYTKSEIETLTKTVTGAKVKPFIIALPITGTKTKTETATQTLNKLFTIPKIETSTRTAVIPTTQTKSIASTKTAVMPLKSAMTSLVPITTPEIITEPLTKTAIRNITKTLTQTETFTPERTKLAMPYFEQVPIGKKKGRKSRYNRFLKLYSIGKPENILGSLSMPRPKRKIKSKASHRKKRRT